MENALSSFTGEKFAGHFDFWQEQMGTVLKRPYAFRGNLPISVSRNPFRRKSFRLSGGTKIIRNYAFDGDLESFILLLSGFYILFHRYKEEAGIVIETPLNKNKAGKEDIWEGKVPVGIALSEQMTIKDVIQKVNELVVSGYKYQNFPFSVLPDLEGTTRGSGSSNILIYDLSLHLPPSEEQLEAYDLVIEIVNEGTPEDLVYNISANPAVFSDWFIDELFEHHRQIILAFENLDLSLESVSIFSPEEYEKITETFNASGFDFPRELTVVDVFERQVDATPSNTAVIYRGRRLSYRELNERSNRLANALIDKYGIVPGSFVGVMLDRSEHLIVSLLAILKAGAVYVPIDPKIPQERILYMVQDAGIGLMLTHSDHLFEIPDFAGNIFVVDIQSESLDCRTQDPERCFGPSDLAYVIYTSGSTGRSKGVLVEHLGLLNVSLHHVHELEMKEHDVYLQFMASSFDGSLLDIFTALLSGAALLLPDKEIIDNTEKFLKYITDNKASVLTLTPSYLGTLEKNVLPGVRVLITAGEAARIDDARFYAAFKAFYNGYGPSEVTVNASLHRCQPVLQSDIVPIGRPGANKCIYILDEKLRVVPTGVIGEICIAGDGLARGYLNDTALTAEKFIRHPFNNDQRMYRSGDLGRWLPDGTLEYAGRKDEQVKLNGFRVDLGEIECTLQQEDHVQYAAVAVNDIAPTGGKLIAFYQPKQKIEVVPSLGEYFIYDPFLYDSMAKDKMRVEGYKAALKDVVKDKVVLDPGTGRDMILARHCLDAGAKKVYAIEMDEEAYLEALDNLSRYSLKNKIVLIKGNVSDIDLPERIDYIVSALAGNIASSDGCIPIMNSIREKLAYMPDFVPSRYVTRIAAVNLPAASYDQGLSEISAHYISRVFDRYGYTFDPRLCLRYFQKERLISDAGICEEIDYTRDLVAEEAVTLNLSIQSASKFNGFVLWINAFANEEQLMIDSLCPTHHLPVYFPISEEGIDVERGDIIRITFERKLSDNRLNPDYFIRGVIAGKEKLIDIEYSSYNHKAGFRPASFYSSIFDESGKVRITKTVNGNTFKRFLGDRLPAYMIPAGFVKVSGFPVTGNGKIDKRSLLKEYLSGTEEDVVKDPPRNDMEKLLLKIIRMVLGREDIGIYDDFFKIGGDSIKAIQIASRMHKEGYKLEVRHLFSAPVIADLAMVAEPLIKSESQVPVVGPIRLTPIQKELFPPGIIDPHHYNQAVMFYSGKRFSIDVIDAVFNKLYMHHDILRAIFKIADGQWQQYNRDDDEVLKTEEIDLIADDDAVSALEITADRMQSGFDLEHGPLVKVGLFHLADGDRLLVIIHHLVVDTVSWRILFEDLEELLEQSRDGRELSLPLKTLSFKDWSERLYAYANSADFLKEKAYWRQLDTAVVRPLVKDRPGNTTAQAEMLEIGLTETETKDLVSLAQTVFNVSVMDLLVAAIAISVESLTGSNRVLLALEGHGREDISGNANLGRTVGWFTSMYPVLIDIDNTGDLIAVTRKVRDYLARVPHKGIGHGLLKHMTEEINRTDISFNLSPQISFNYLGQFDADLDKMSLRIAAESVGKMKSERRGRLHDLDIKGLIAGHRLALSVSYSTADFKYDRMRGFINGCKSVLQEMISVGKETRAIPSITDFGYKELSVEDLESLFD